MVHIKKKKKLLKKKRLGRRQTRSKLNEFLKAA